MSVSCDLVASRGVNKKMADEWIIMYHFLLSLSVYEVACWSVQIEKLNLLCSTDCILNSNTGARIITIRSSRGYRFST